MLKPKIRKIQDPPVMGGMYLKLKIKKTLDKTTTEIFKEIDKFERELKKGIK